MSSTDKNRIEDLTKIVYGETFGRYSESEFLEFLRPLEQRLERNNIPLSSFSGKLCLDAGCGGGRGTILMARAGASQVIAYDLSEKNFETTTGRAKQFGLTNIQTQLGNLLELPFPDEHFDVVWCNGVLHHTVDPDRSLCEVARVLKRGGQMWLYLYGSGGIYARLVHFFRSWLSDVSISETIAALACNGTPTGRIAEFIDDWCVPILKAYTDKDVSTRLSELGFKDTQLLSGGPTYDSSSKDRSSSDQRWFGGGDLRYWATKVTHVTNPSGHPLPDVDNKGSAFKDQAEVSEIDNDLERLKIVVSQFENTFPRLKYTSRVAIAARLQTKLRDDMNSKISFDGELYKKWLREQIDILSKFMVK